MTSPRFALAALAFATMAAMAPAHAVIYTYTGDTTGGPTFNRAFEDFSGLSGIGNSNPYHTFEFTVSVAGPYTFVTTGPTFDTFIFLYSPSFNPASATSNGVNANDDLLPGFTTSGFAQTLSTGVAYTLVTTGFAPGDFGAFSTTIGGPGVVTLVPEPATYALFAFGLAGVGMWARRRLSA